MKNIKFINVLVLIMSIMLVLSSCGEKLPTECPDYIDLSLTNEESQAVDFFETADEVLDINRTTALVEEKLPEKATLIECEVAKGRTAISVVYMVNDNVLYIVEYEKNAFEESDKVAITKLAVRDGDKYIYKADNWSGSGVMVAEYCNMYYDYFNKHYESIGKELLPVPEKLPLPSVPSDIDLSIEKEKEHLPKVIAINFNEMDNPLEKAKEFVPEGATVYDARNEGKAVFITYISKDGVLYEAAYFDVDKGSVRKTALRATDHYKYRIVENTNSKETAVIVYLARQDINMIYKPMFDDWRKARGLSEIAKQTVLNSKIWDRLPDNVTQLGAQ